jgi:hypothetical protein
MPKKQLVGEGLIGLHPQPSRLPARSPERGMMTQETANLYRAFEREGFGDEKQMYVKWLIKDSLAAKTRSIRFLRRKFCAS